MCGRFTQACTWAEVHHLLSVIGPAHWARATTSPPRCKLTLLGLARAGVSLSPYLPSPFNARGETVPDNPARSADRITAFRFGRWRKDAALIEMAQAAYAREMELQLSQHSLTG
jgi:hypothetical protein